MYFSCADLWGLSAEEAVRVRFVSPGALAAMNQRPKVLSLFTGAGGLDIGFHNAGFDIVCCVEVDALMCRTIEANIGLGKQFGTSCRVLQTDIREFDPGLFRDVGIDFVTGGPPCQTFSAAGRRGGGVIGVRDKRGMLFESYCRILDALQPRGFLFENVYGLPGAEQGEAWRMITSGFETSGYRLFHRVLDAADYGVPQFRERLFLVGLRDGVFLFPRPTYGPDASSKQPYVTAMEAIGDLQDPTEQPGAFGGRWGDLVEGVPEGLNYSFYTGEMGHPKPVFAWRSKFSDFMYKAARDEPVRTIKAQPGKYSGPIHWNNRAMTVAELKRLQSIPDHYVIAGSSGQAMRLIGNSVPPRLAEMLAEAVRAQAFSNIPGDGPELMPDGFKLGFRARKRERTRRYRAIAAEAIGRLRDGDGDGDWQDRAMTYIAAFRSLIDYQVIERVVPSQELVADGALRRYSVVSEIRSLPDVAEQVASGEVAGSGLQLQFLLEGMEPGKNQRLEMTGNRVDGPDEGEITVGVSGLASRGFAFDEAKCRATASSAFDVSYAWKLLEYDLLKRSRYMSLVEIYGYYADNSGGITTAVEVRGPFPEADRELVEYFSNRAHCAVELEEARLAAQFKLSVHELYNILERMRAACYDVRNRATHGNMTEGHVLCAYPFAQLYGEFQLQRRLRPAGACGWR